MNATEVPTAAMPQAPDPVIIVGAGLAGLTAAVALHEAGVPVHVYEAADVVGGRVRTDRHAEGFLLDRGFQVLFDAYPAVRRWVDVNRLRPRAFDAALHVWTGRRLVPLADPLRHPAGALRDLSTSLISSGDKVRLARLAFEAGNAPWESARDAAASLSQDVTAAEYLWARGFSEAFIARLARPFWGGITLSPHLEGSAGPLLFTLKMLARGSAVLPAGGLGALPAQLLERLPTDALSLNAPVTSVVTEDGRAVGVRVARRKIAASAVIVATDAAAAAKLTGLESRELLRSGPGCTTIYLAGTRRPRTGPRLVIDATRQLTVNHLAPVSETQPTYAPAGLHLVAAVVVGERAASHDLEALGELVRNDAATMLGDAPGSWRVLEVMQTPHAQFAQPPGVYARLPGNLTPVRGLVLASEATVDSSQNGAMRSGETAADVVKRELALRALGSWT